MLCCMFKLIQNIAIMQIIIMANYQYWSPTITTGINWFSVINMHVMVYTDFHQHSHQNVTHVINIVICITTYTFTLRMHMISRFRLKQTGSYHLCLHSFVRGTCPSLHPLLHMHWTPSPASPCRPCQEPALCGLGEWSFCQLSQWVCIHQVHWMWTRVHPMFGCEGRQRPMLYEN